MSICISNFNNFKPFIKNDENFYILHLYEAQNQHRYNCKSITTKFLFNHRISQGLVKKTAGDFAKLCYIRYFAIFVFVLNKFHCIMFIQLLSHFTQKNWHGEYRSCPYHFLIGIYLVDIENKFGFSSYKIDLIDILAL